MSIHESHNRRENRHFVVLVAACITFAVAITPAYANSRTVPVGLCAADTSSKDDRAQNHFPQPVRAGDLLGRKLLAPVEWQPVLGWISGVVRESDGTVDLLVDIDGWFGGYLGIGSRTVAVQTDAVALLGEHVALLDLNAKELETLPTFVSGSAMPVNPDDVLRIGIVKPFH